MALTAANLSLIRYNPANTLIGGPFNGSAPLSGAINEIFDPIQPDEALSGESEYRCLVIQNTSATETFVGLKAYFSSQTSSPDTTISMALALADGGISPYPPLGVEGVNYPPATANENTAPAGATFTAPTSVANALLLGNLGPQSHTFIWLRRTVSPGAASTASDACTFVVTNAAA